MVISVELGDKSYDIIIERGALGKCSELLDLNRKAFIVTDSGVPAVYAEAVKAGCREGYIFTVPQGEGSKLSWASQERTAL